MADDNLSDFFEPEGERGAFDDPDQEWYFDLPSGAWERQEQKNRELRQAVKRNTNPNEPQAVARVAPVKRRAEGPWQSSGGTWQLDKGGGSSALESAPLRASRPEPASRWSSDGDGGYDEEEGPPIVDRVRAWPRSSADEPSNSSGEAPGIPFLRRENTPSGRPPQPVATAGAAIGEDEHEPEQEQEGSLWGGPEAAAKRRVLKAATFGESAAGAPEYAPPPPAEEEIGKRNLWMAGDDPLPVQTPAKRRNLWKAELEAARALQAAAAETEARTESERSEPAPAPASAPERAMATAAPLLPASLVIAADEQEEDEEIRQKTALEFDSFADVQALFDEPIPLPEEPGAEDQLATDVRDPLAPLPLMRRSYDAEPAEEPDGDGEPKSRWDEVFQGQKVGGGILDAMRDWIVQEQEDDARARDVTQLPPELLQPFDWENESPDEHPVTFEDTPAARESVASLAGHIWSGISAPAGPRAEEPVPAEDVAAAWRAPVPEEARDAPSIVATLPEDPPGGTEPEWGGSSWQELTPEGSAPSGKRPRGLLGRLFGKGIKNDGDLPSGPEWTVGGPGAWASLAENESPAWAPVEEILEAEPALARIETPPLAVPVRRDWDDQWFEQAANRAGAVTEPETPLGPPIANLALVGHNEPEALAPQPVLDEEPAPPAPLALGRNERTGMRPTLRIVRPGEDEDDPWAAFIAAREEEETPFRFASEDDARRTGS